MALVTTVPTGGEEPKAHLLKASVWDSLVSRPGKRDLALIKRH